MIRFEPVHALYEQELMHHCGRFTDLEYQLLTYTGDPKQKSPNSLDAMVWRNNKFKHITANQISLLHNKKYK